MNIPLLVPAGFFAAAFVAGVLLWLDKRSKSILQKWADDHGFEILHKRQRYLIFTGPFKWWTNSRNQIVYSFQVRCRDGRERSGWARCGSYFGGTIFSDQVEVRWDDV